MRIKVTSIEIPNYSQRNGSKSVNMNVKRYVKLWSKHNREKQQIRIQYMIQKKRQNVVKLLRT